MSFADTDREQLEHWAAAHGTPQQVALRCRILLAAAAGRTNLEIGEEFRINVKTVALWRGRFAKTGPEGLWEIAAGRGRKSTYSADKILSIVQATLQTKPKAWRNGAAARWRRHRASENPLSAISGAATT